MILHVVDDSIHKDAPQEAGPAVHLDETSVLPSDAELPSREAERASHSRKSSVASIVAINDIQSSASRSSTHYTWPLVPKKGFIDKEDYPDLQRTIEDFLITFFRLWEQSRVGLKSLYDPLAVFSNLLAKQGCQPSKVTKSTGWSKISPSIARLPALSNDALEDLIVDAWPIPTNPSTLMCTVHGAFSEFPKNIKRAFDRTFILRPVDNNLYPSEGCLGVIKWIILSDTLTIRKHTAQTTAVTSGFKQQCALEAERLRSTTRESDVDTRPRSVSRRRDLSEEVPTPSTSLLVSREPNAIPACELPLAFDDDRPIPSIHDDFVNEERAEIDLRSSSPVLPHVEAIPEAVDAGPAGHIAELAAQVREMRSELNRLRNAPQVDSQAIPARAPVIPVPDRTRPSSVASLSSNTDRFSDRYRISNSFAYPHRGFGVTKKRYLIPTDMDVYLNISLRGDIVTWHKKDRSKVQLLLSGSSPTDKVESACYSNAHQTLVVGSCMSSVVRSAKTPQVALIKLMRTVKLVLNITSHSLAS